MSDRRDLVWYEIDRLRREADKLERTARRHDDHIMFNDLEKFIDKYAVSFCIGMFTGAFALWMRLHA